MILDKEDVINRIALRDDYSKDDIEKISDLFMESIIEILKQGHSIKYNKQTPLFKTKVSKSSVQEGSPKTKRNDRIICSIKIPIQNK